MTCFRALVIVYVLAAPVVQAVEPDSAPKRLPKVANSAIVAGPTFTLSLQGVESYVGVADNAGNGVPGTSRGDLFLRANQTIWFSMNGGVSAPVRIDPAGNITATSFAGNASSATTFSGNLSGDVSGTQGATRVVSVGGQTAAAVANGVLSANAATSADTANTIVKRDASGRIVITSLQFADGTVLTTASMRKYYLANVNASGSQASSGCAIGFHMASMWELVNPSALSYDTTRGITYADSGTGPPQEAGWVRTGNVASGSSTVGLGNCMAWTSNVISNYGTAAQLTGGWSFNPQTNTSGSIMTPWSTVAFTCNNSKTVWCIQDQ